ncbi:MAG TPA: Fis family transcriptional regulator [Thermoanaerobaculia bacterium]|nr:Fis family transcriptional regulator [Thermoanaerobaculia bacterium]
MAEIFTDEWAGAWCRAIQASDAYKSAAAGWDGAVAVVMSADPEYGVREERAVFLDLADGDCRGGRTAGTEELAAAVFVLQAPPAVWKRVLGREIEPIWGLMSGKIALAKGSISKLIPYTRAAKEMVEQAVGLEADFPPGWPREDDTP